MQAMLAASRKRVNDSHLLQMEKLKEVTGYQGELSEDEEVGDINIFGDTNITQPDTPQPAATLPTMASGLSKAALVAAILASGGVGSALTLLLSQWLNQPAVVESSDTDTDTISVIDFPE